MFTETWYHDDSSFFVLNGYTHFTLNRCERRGGGISLQILNSVVPTENSKFSTITPDFEILTVECGRNVFTVLYRPPDGKLDSFFSMLEALLDHVSLNQQILYLCGDMNIDVSFSSPAQLELTGLLDAYGFYNVIEVPTRVTLSTSTVLDLIITNTEKQNVHAGTLVCDISDHLPIFAFVNETHLNAECEFPRARYQRIDVNTLECFRDKIRATNWEGVLSHTDADSAYEALIDKLKSSYENCFPFLYHRKRKAKKPWVTADLLQKIKMKQIIFTVYEVKRH